MKPKIFYIFISIIFFALCGTILYFHKSLTPKQNSVSPNEVTTENGAGLLLLSGWNTGDGIDVYGTPDKMSPSGDFVFNRTEQDGSQFQGDGLFLVSPNNPKDKVNTDKIYKTISQYPKAVYEITGTKQKDNCSYYTTAPLAGTCLSSILFEQITRIVTDTSTATVNGYTIQFSRTFAEDNPDLSLGTDVSILKDGKSLFKTEETQEFGGFYFDGIGNWFKNAGDVKRKAIKDITGDGIPELILEGYSGGAHCCTHNYVISLSSPLSILLDLDTGDEGIDFKDLNHDGVMEIETSEDIFAYWHTDFSDSPFPRVVLSLQNGKYKADPNLMRKPAPSDVEIKKMAKATTNWDGYADPGVAWKYVLDLIYSGNIVSARKYVDLAWRDGISTEFKTKEDFWKELIDQIHTSPYYSSLFGFLGL